MRATLPILLALAGDALGAPPATVLEHHVQVVATTGRPPKRTVTWRIRVEDPQACSAGLLAPEGLDGALVEGASVFEDVVVFPPGIQTGDVFELVKTTDLPKEGHSGVLLSATDLVTEHARLTLTLPPASPLHVWHDAAGAPTHSVGRTRNVVIDWVGVPADRPAQAVWSTWEDWSRPGGALVDRVSTLYADKLQLGRDLAAASTGMSVQEAVERVYDRVKLDSGSLATWAEARPATEVVAAGSGSAVDRAVVLLSLLRVAGYDALPGLYRPSDQFGAFPVSVPAPAMLERPVVVVQRDKGRTYIDPAAEHVEVSHLPASMIGGTVWTPGDLPVQVAAGELHDGAVNVGSTLSVALDGSTSWQATVTASGTATEWFRQLLAPLDGPARAAVVEKLLRQARPEIQRLSVEATGLEKPTASLRIAVAGQDPGKFAGAQHGLVGSVPPVLAPALAGWLPPNLLVRETMTIQPPGTLELLASMTPPPTIDEAAIVTRGHHRQGRREVVTVEIERPYRARSPARDAAARDLLAREATAGFQLILARVASKDVAAEIAESTRYSPSERAALGAMLWWSVANQRKAQAVIEDTLPTLGDEDVVAAFDKFLPAGGESRGYWLTLDAAAAEAGRSELRLAIARALARRGENRAAWLLAHGITTQDPPPSSATRVSALLLIDTLQPSEPPAGDPEAASAWRERDTLLREAEAHAAEAGPRAETELLLRRARIAVDAGDTTGAEVLLEKALARGPNPVAEVLLAHASAAGGVAVQDIVERIERAVQQAPFDVDVVSLAADTLGVLHVDGRALELGLRAARLAGTDAARWVRVIDLSFAAGNLPSAAYAARRASDLRPDDPALGARLALLAAMSSDPEGVERGRTRAAGRATPDPDASLAQLLEVAPPESVLALLTHRDVEAVRDPSLLAMRAQLRVEHGDLDGAARDGVLLATRHGDPQGWALAFAATAGRTIGTGESTILGSAASDPVTLSTRMEYSLLTGRGDALADARALGDDPRARAVRQLVEAPQTLAAAVPGWPAGLPTTTWNAPAGYAPNALLGGVAGVRAWSDPVSATAIMRIGGIAGVLPPPLANLYTPGAQPRKTYANGGQLLRLDGGYIPLFAALTLDGGEELIALGFTAESAERALGKALQ